ncbi:MAG TPA: alpha/beta hydrolase [Vicinamibacterales bacterium]|jgi:proline iminopeptidase|nr:alpha/beta hydrolase [Vicinamibacterales bacterium]
MTTHEGYITTADELRLFYRQTGTGPSVALFINGVPTVDDFASILEGRTIVFFDPRNRGRSDTARDRSQIERGVHHDVDDLETIRTHFGVDQVDVIGHSYAGVTVALYAMKHPSSVRRVVQIGSMAPDQSREYPPDLRYADEVLANALAQLGELMKEQATLDPVEMCRRFWTIINPIYVMNPADIVKLKWARCDSANERNFMAPWVQYLQPSIQQLKLTAEDFGCATMPVLVIHGTKDRSGPYGGARDWARLLPNARLLTVHDAAHVPWIEAPGLVLDSIRTFLDGEWPAAAERIA